MPSGCRLEGATGGVALSGATVQEHIREIAGMSLQGIEYLLAPLT